MAPASCIAVLGTGSDVGKSIITAGICRWLTDAGMGVVPYKAQNMSNNSGVTPDGLEMGRAQIVQAEASGVVPTVDMNPVLLKPTSDLGSQVVVMGKVCGDATAKAYYRDKERLFRIAAEALDRLRNRAEAVIMEGAGSCAEVNLMDRDIVNFPMADHANAAVILVADIHRGGVFGQVVGTLECLPERFRKRVAGIIINRFRGDVDLFHDGVAWLENRTGLPVFGVVPWVPNLGIQDEDAVAIEAPPPQSVTPGGLPAIAVIRLPHIANFTDMDPLAAMPEIQLHFLEQPQSLTGFAAVILPGTKNTRRDLEWLRSTGWSERIAEYAHAGGAVLGICGGYQLMGRTIADPDGLEGPAGTSDGLSLLPVNTVLQAPKSTRLTRFDWDGAEGLGYEIHMGRTERLGGSAFIHCRDAADGCSRGEDGCIADTGRWMGTYVHGFFDAPAVTGQWLNRIGITGNVTLQDHGLPARQLAYGRLAHHLDAHVDMNAIADLVKGKNR